MRPTNNFPAKNITIDEDKGYININIPKKKEDGIVNHQQENWSFNFDKILINESQETLFEMTGTRVVDNALEGTRQHIITPGLSSSIIAYGQTGAGKTFTMVG